MERSEEFNTKFIQSLFKNHSSLFHPIKSVCFIYIKVRGESDHHSTNAYPLYMHLLSFELFFSYMTSQELHYLLHLGIKFERF